MSGRQQKVMVQPINVIFRYLQQQTRVSLWLYDNVEFRIEGTIIGFDEFMNVTLDDAAEVRCSDQERKELGRLLLKGDNISISDMLNTPLARASPPLSRHASHPIQAATYMGASLSILAVALAASSLAGPIHYECQGADVSELHTETLNTQRRADALPTPHSLSSNQRHRAAHIADFVQTIKDAAQLGPI
ncbi:hypothetical protein MCUN1_001628 [Malassezia cuniculi]|uniref:Small nuclear ribonucleoprotein E n=1 Tax=Malassezia cuniculi TaxID=948313 RepID=A0AAF0J6P8_9BASI|nr:hypothetical protein MCUN1_001628 [Malassezia cuniculi]